MSEQAFEFKLVNGLAGDPAVYVFLKQLSDAILFDLGSLETLSNKDLLRVRQVFVSHTHMDHFIGFDRLLRVNIPHRRLLRIWGPAPFIERVQAKLRAYTWNLIDPDQVRVAVSEIHGDGRITEALLTNSDGFAIREQSSQQSLQHLFSFADGSRMQAVLLDHKGIASVAYRLETPNRLRVKIEAMEALGLEAGPWLGQLQTKLRNKKTEEVITVQHRTWTVGALGEALMQHEMGRSFVYLTDASFDRVNLQRLRQAFPGTSDMLSESSFADVDVKRAVDKAHLTTRQSALLARALGVERFHVFHVSGIYGQGPASIAEEAQRLFQELSSSEWEAALEAELLRCEALLGP
jgi:ribonuclease Z